MRPIRLIGACLAVLGAVFLPLALPSVAFASPESRLDKEIAVFTSKGVPVERAEQALDVQGKVARANLVHETEAAMGGAYAGAWFDASAAQLHFGVTSLASREAAERVALRDGLAAAVAYTPVRSAWSALMTLQSRWNSRLASLLANQQAMTGLDAEHNAVVVTLSSSIPASERALLEGEAAASDANVFVESARQARFATAPRATCKKFKIFEAYCEKTLVSGVGIAPGTVEPECSAGPMLIEAKETWMLTAGHCFAKKVGESGEVVVKVTSAYPEKEKPAQKEIGKEGLWKYLLAKDMAIVKIKRPGSFTQELPIPVPALLMEWEKKTESPQSVIGEAANVKGEANCRVGMTTGERCGEILRVNITTPAGFEHLVEDTACAGGGDSGGPFFFSNGKVNNVTMQGMLVRGEKECGEAGVKTYYEPLKDEGAEGFGILSNFAGKTLLTTANQSR